MLSHGICMPTGDGKQLGKVSGSYMSRSSLKNYEDSNFDL